MPGVTGRVREPGRISELSFSSQDLAGRSWSGRAWRLILWVGDGGCKTFLFYDPSEIIDGLRVEVITCRKECKKEELHHCIVWPGHRVPASISDPVPVHLFLSVLKLAH